jgi:hypothetical protein
MVGWRYKLLTEDLCEEDVGPDVEPGNRESCIAKGMLSRQDVVNYANYVLTPSSDEDEEYVAKNPSASSVEADVGSFRGPVDSNEGEEFVSEDPPASAVEADAGYKAPSSWEELFSDNLKFRRFAYEQQSENKRLKTEVQLLKEQNSRLMSLNQGVDQRLEEIMNKTNSPTGWSGVNRRQKHSGPSPRALRAATLRSSPRLQQDSVMMGERSGVGNCTVGASSSKREAVRELLGMGYEPHQVDAALAATRDTWNLKSNYAPWNHVDWVHAAMQWLVSANSHVDGSSNAPCVRALILCGIFWALLFTDIFYSKCS